MVMAQALRYEHPYASVIGDLVAISKRQPGWNSYDAEQVSSAAVLSAIGLVNALSNLGGDVPAPAVGASADGGVVLRWLTREREVEIFYTGRERGDYTITRRSSREVVAEGPLAGLDPLKDIVDAHVLGRRSLDRPRW
jgi:hypothetical protein